MTHFDIRFTPQELDYIANVLMDRPHREVAVLLANMKGQIDHAQKLDQMRPTVPTEPLVGDAIPQPLVNGHAQ